jgi:hypothetical protein
MRVPRLALAAVAAAGAIALSGCADDMYGPYGYGYGAYGYGYSPYGYGYAPYGYGYGYPYGGYGYYDAYYPFGWYDDFYYPGVGIFVYDRFRNRRVWNGGEQRFWMNRRSTWQSHGGTTGPTGTRENWSGFSRGPRGTGGHHGR